MAVRLSFCSSSTTVQPTHWDRSGIDSSDEHLVARWIFLRRLHGDYRARSGVVLSSQRDSALLMLPRPRAALPGLRLARLRTGIFRERSHSRVFNSSLRT